MVKKNLTPVARKALPLDPIDFARSLIGCHLVRDMGADRLCGRIVETEAYLQDDEASHSFKGRTTRNGSMFLERGHAYIYRIYGLYWCLNVSAGREGEGAAVLIRAVEPIFGVEAMRERRSEAPLRDLARGPARLAAAFGVDGALNGADLCRKGPLWLASGEARSEIGESVRIGLTRAVDARLRFFERHSPYLSGPKALNL